jgi:LysR family transcriptional regulator, glycine cleavage system transcriptional activator
MTRRLPTLKGLQAFEAAYEFRSYTKAAKALNVQQPAISYQIKMLEKDLGVRLFERVDGRLVPAAHADVLYETVSHAFDSIREVSRRFRELHARRTTTIATYSGIATYWLTPRIAMLSERLGTTTRIVALVNDADLFREKPDCWIVFGAGQWRGFEARMLLQEEVCPVASPALADRLQANTDAILPAGISIIEQEDLENRWLSWDDWQKQSAETSNLNGPHVTVNDYGLALHMALAGSGITLGWTAVINDLLEGGSLVRISEQSVKSDAGYWLVGRPGFFETSTGKAIYEILSES